MKIQNLIELHVGYYKEIQVVDIIKLLHQKNFGPGHFLANIEKARQMFDEEMLKMEKMEKVLRPNYIEHIGKYARVYLDIPDIDKDTIFDMFVKSTQIPEDSSEVFYEDVIKFRDMEIFDKDEINHFLKKWENDRKPFSHSEIYRNFYKPAYRVVLADLFCESAKQIKPAFPKK
ncbi:MAG: hypothetical protein FWG63_06145 [Defluviitaleaceae bacterium]|nr:hypothetical protein [Defluviitaleaceae bacterium]